jgi:diguanylate cyclase (GGDEF)-like protein
MAKGVLLAIVTLISVVTFAGWFILAPGSAFPGGLQLMNAETALAVLLTSLSLYLSDQGSPRWMQLLSLSLAILVALVAAVTLVEYWFQLSLSIHQLLPYDHDSTAPLPGRMSAQAAGAFLILGIAIALMRRGTKVAYRLVDVLLFGLCFLVLVLISAKVFVALGVSSGSMSDGNSWQTLLCLLLLTAVAVNRQSINSIFAIFLWRGIGGNIARLISPVFLVLPFLRETVRARIIGVGQMPAPYTSAVLSSLTAMLALALLLVIVWRINSMELEIHDLSLRDEMSGVYNLRGFTLLAEQALGLARRAQQPFSVLMVELENMQPIEDSIGNSASSASLAATGSILRTTFRDTDVIGRVGRNEFAVAGHFGQMGIDLAAQRLQLSSEQRNAEAGVQFVLNFIVGYVTSEEGGQDSLDDLMARAGLIIYRERRRREMDLP